MEPEQLKARLPTAAYAFRGYDVTNLGRSDALLAHRAYGEIVRQELATASQIYTEITGQHCAGRSHNDRYVPTKTVG